MHTLIYNTDRIPANKKEWTVSSTEPSGEEYMEEGLTFTEAFAKTLEKPYGLTLHVSKCRSSNAVSVIKHTKDLTYDSQVSRLNLHDVICDAPKLLMGTVVDLGDGVKFSTVTNKLHIGNSYVVPTPIQKKVLALLVKNRGTVVELEDIIDAAWGRDVADATVRNQFCLIRKLIKDTRKNKIVSVPNMGYVLKLDI